MKPARVDRDPKPDNVPEGRGVELAWHESIDPRRLRRVAAILADILDSAGTPDKDGRR